MIKVNDKVVIKREGHHLYNHIALVIDKPQNNLYVLQTASYLLYMRGEDIIPHMRLWREYQQPLGKEFLVRP